MEKALAAMHDPSSKYVVVVSHRGDWRNFPENSLLAIESTIEKGVDMVEIDLKLTSDSVLVLSHDHTCDRVTTGKGPISTMTYDSLRTFELKNIQGEVLPGTHIATLREALEACKGKILVNVDQGYEYYDQVLAITEELGVTDQILIKSGRAADIVTEKMAEFPHNMMYMPVVNPRSEDGRSILDQFLDADVPPLACEMCFDKLDGDVRDCAKSILDSGSKLWVNTLWDSLCGGHDDEKAYAASDPGEVYGPILDLGTSIIQTDRPAYLIQYLESIGRR